ncbi:hypothetical protein [Asanoa siamensis]|uniref:Uncharacterized protein n=1 Tax=Asanoa siamensis TaxID=926357 RepID=A0ABQ4CJZ6_9ACTN|nr:hypothetical protein [Asanoa siamensis]GIF71601.1 hypothetical protein Asi02nite_11190 [Asanoa siamensis]
MRLKDIVDLATSEAPPPRYDVDEIVARGRGEQRRRRTRTWATSGAAALAVLGVVAAAVQAGTERAPAEVAAASAGPLVPVPVDAPPFTFTVDGYQVGRLRVARPIDVSRSYQLSPVYSDDLVTNDRAVDPDEPAVSSPSLYAYLTVYRPGAYDPSRLPGATTVDVGGRRGLEATAPNPGGMAIVRTLAWEYADGAWAVIDANSSEAEDPSAAELRALAAGLRGTAPRPAKVPVTLGHVPDGYRLDEVAMHAMTGLNGIASARDGDHAGLLFSRPGQPTSGLTEPFGGVEGRDVPNSFVVYVVPAGNSNQRPSPRVTCGAYFCNRWSPDGAVNVQVASGGPGALPTPELAKILSDITLADVADESTWTRAPAVVR